MQAGSLGKLRRAIQDNPIGTVPHLSSVTDAGFMVTYLNTPPSPTATVCYSQFSLQLGAAALRQRHSFHVNFNVPARNIASNPVMILHVGTASIMACLSFLCSGLQWDQLITTGRMVSSDYFRTAVLHPLKLN